MKAKTFSQLPEKLIASVGFVCYAAVVGAQTYNMPGGTITTCSGNFFDDGGSAGNYSNGQNKTTTFCATAGNCIRVNMTSFDSESGFDQLYVYDGPNTSSTQILEITAADVPGLIIASGSCLTFNFISDGSANSTGWAAAISCSSNCGQGVTAPNLDCSADGCLRSSAVSIRPSICSGSGIDELNASNWGCLGTGESCPHWYTITISTSGNLQLLINDDLGTMCTDFNFAVWGPSPTCPPTAPPVRCSSAGSCGITGIHSGYNSPQTDVSDGPFGNRFVQDLSVLAGEQYLILIDDLNSTGTSVFTLQGTATYGCAPLALPIQLLNVTANCIATPNTVRVAWQTATETNNDYFTIERSADAISWEAAGTVKGAGNSSATRNYEFIDNVRNFLPPSGGGGALYYRLKQTDFDGKTETFNAQQVAVDVTECAVQVFPNPAGNTLNVPYTAEQDGEITLQVYDVIGKLVKESRVLGIKGNNKFTMDLSTVASGMYVLKIKNSSAKEQNQKFVKQISQ